MPALSLKLSLPDLEAVGPVCLFFLAAVTMYVTLETVPWKSYFIYFLGRVWFPLFSESLRGHTSCFQEIATGSWLTALCKTVVVGIFPSCRSYHLHHSNSTWMNESCSEKVNSGWEKRPANRLKSQCEWVQVLDLQIQPAVLGSKIQGKALHVSRIQTDFWCCCAPMHWCITMVLPALALQHDTGCQVDSLSPSIKEIKEEKISQPKA